MSERLRAQLLKNSDFFPDPLGNNVIEGLAVGTIFSSSGTKELGAESVVLSGQYEDDGDQGNVIIYTGTGGQKNSFNGTGPQVKDQSFDHRMNQQLYKSYQNKRPIRVIRGSNLDSQYAPAEGYRYDGMYRVTDAYMDEGYRGYAICKFKLERLPGQPPIPIAR